MALVVNKVRRGQIKPSPVVDSAPHLAQPQTDLANALQRRASQLAIRRSQQVIPANIDRRFRAAPDRRSDCDFGCSRHATCARDLAP